MRQQLQNVGADLPEPPVTLAATDLQHRTLDPRGTFDAALPGEQRRPRQRFDIEASHLSITQTRESGGSRNIHLLETGDLGVILHTGQAERGQIPHDAVKGTIAIALNVDQGYDAVHYSNVAFVGGAEEVIGHGARGAGHVQKRSVSRRNSRRS